MQHKLNAPAQTVLDLLTNAKWLEARCLALGDISASVKTKKKAGQVIVTMHRRISRELPGMLAKVLPPESDMVLEETWTLGDKGEATGSMTVEMVGQPVRLGAEFSLSASGKGCVYDISHSAKSSVPFLAGSIEKFAQKKSEEACSDELEYLADALKKAK